MFDHKYRKGIIPNYCAQLSSTILFLVWRDFPLPFPLPHDLFYISEVEISLYILKKLRIKEKQKKDSKIGFWCFDHGNRFSNSIPTLLN